MKAIHLLYLLPLLVVAGLRGRVVAIAEANAVPEASLVTVTPLADGLEVVWRAPQLQFTTAPEGVPQPSRADYPSLPGYTTLQKPGYPQVPTHSLLVALPHDAHPTVTRVATRATNLASELAIPLAPAPAGVVQNESGDIIGGGFAPNLAEAMTLPLVSLEELGIMRGIRLARLTFAPLQPTPNGFKLTKMAQVRVSFGMTIPIPPPEGEARWRALDPIQQQIAAQVANPTQIPSPSPLRQAQGRIFQWEGDQIPPPLGEARWGSAASNDRLTAVLEISDNGLIAVTYDQLQAAGYPVDSINPHHLTLRQGETEIGLEWEGDADTQFEAGEQLLFVAQNRFSRWQPGDAYLLYAAETAVPRLTTQSASPSNLPEAISTTTTLFEQNHLYTPDCICGTLPAGRDGDRWVWADLRRPGQPSQDFSFELAAVSPTEPAILTLWLIGFTDVPAMLDHRVAVNVNDVSLGEIVWDGKTAVSRTLALPAGLLQANNSLTLTLPGLDGVGVEGAWLDAFAVTTGTTAAADNQPIHGNPTPHAYQLATSATDLRLYNITNPNQPQRLVDWELSNGTLRFGDGETGNQSYVISSEITQPDTIRLAQPLPTATTADYLIITPPDFRSALDPLIGLRQSQGLAVVVAETMAIGDGFGNGRFDPNALQAYLRHAYQQWQPSYALLVGDGSSDPRQYRPNSAVSWLPPFLIDSDPWIGEIAADNRYVAVDGDDPLPDMAIGRLPINSLGEATAVIDKIVAYEMMETAVAWPLQTLLVADNADAAGNFANQSNHLANLLPRFWRLNRRYHQQPAPITTSDIRQDWEAELVIYNGHSSIHQWGAERFFHLDDVANLPSDTLPIVLQMTCFTGSFQHPAFDALDEALLRRPDGGALAVWGATGLGVATGHHELATGFLNNLVAADNFVANTVGNATLAGKLTLATHQLTHLDLLDTFTLLGDPATRFPAAALTGTAVYLPFLSSSQQ